MVMEPHRPGTRTSTEMRLIEVEFQQPHKHESLKILLFLDARIDLFQVLNKKEIGSFSLFMLKNSNNFFPFCQTDSYGLKQRSYLWAVPYPHGFEKATKLPGTLGAVLF